MNISYNWLKDYIKFELSPQDVSTALTAIGLETASVNEIQTIKGGLEGLIVGEVITCVEHPNSDHLHITTVDVGSSENLQIVCGAQNVSTGQKVIVAPIGTKLYSGDNSFTIKKSKIRGVESFGMICAEDEIGLSNNHEGIIVLPKDTQVGTLAKDYYSISTDYLIEVDITPNRIDAASHYGVARDLYAYLKQNGHQAVLVKPSIENLKVNKPSNGNTIKISIENFDACPRYTGLTIKNLQVQESPDWLKNRLSIIGLRPINNIVDITNYVLHELGHPLHAYDLATIDGNVINVRCLEDSHHFITLDGVEHNLNKQDLMICNEKEGMCIAGIFGGKRSGVTTTTKNIFLECAYFNPSWIRKTARRQGLNTDSSFRFERGVDPNDAVFVLSRAAHLIKDLAGGQIIGDIQDIYPNTVDPVKIELFYQKVDSLIGKQIPKGTIKSILSSLEINILQEKADSLLLEVPTYRVDVTREVDIIEDILRIYGYNNIEIKDDLKSNLSNQSKTDKNYNLQNIISEQLVGAGYIEILNNSLTKESYYTDLNNFPSSKCVHLINALSNDLNVMRQSLIFGGLETIAYNRNRKNSNLALFEFGNCYFLDKENKDEHKPLQEYREEFHLGLWLTGNRYDNNWATSNEKSSIFQLKGHVESILLRSGLSINDYEYTQCSNDLYSVALQINTRNRYLGTIGIVREKILSKMDIDTEVFFAELNWDEIIQETHKHCVTFQEISKFPTVSRDLSLLLDKSILFSQVEKVARKAEKKLLKSINLFDVYEGKNLPMNKKSYAINFILEDKESTLTDKQINSIMQKIQKSLELELDAQLR